LATFVEKQTVSPEDVSEMVSYAPTERLEWLLKSNRWTDAHGSLRELIDRYEDFLKSTDYPEKEIISKLLEGRLTLRFDNRFGDLVRDAIQSIGGQNRFHRMLIV
jgi:hypothetical protein